MFSIGALAKQAGATVAENSPALLTALGVTGALTTAYLTAKAAFKSAEVIAEEQAKLDKEEKSHPLNTKEKAAMTWQFFIPAAGVAAMTVVSIIGANRISTNRVAAMATAYTVVRNGAEEYKKHVVETIGEKKEQAIRDKMAEDELKRNPLTQSTIVMTGGGGSWCRDKWSGRVFKTDMETVRAAVNTFNEQVINQSYGSLTEFYTLLGLDATQESDMVGWNTDQLLEMGYSWGGTDQNEPCMVISFQTLPHARFASAY